jgi:hypothetical protein
LKFIQKNKLATLQTWKTRSLFCEGFFSFLTPEQLRKICWGGERNNRGCNKLEEEEEEDGQLENYTL